tara:strand:+ start:320 stop:544 length:225 start_codon:yes stop_codon:yes gene_type:complete
MGGSRALARYCIGNLYRIRINKSNLLRELIYGAGNIGKKLILALENKDEFIVSFFIDDDKDKQGRDFAGKSIYA